MSESENEKVVRKIFETLNRRDIDSYMEYYSDDVIAETASGIILNKKGIRRNFLDYLAAFPDLRFKIDRVMTRGNAVMTEWTWTGKHEGELHGLQATNNIVELPGVWIFDLEDGKVKVKKDYFNFSRLMRLLRE